VVERQRVARHDVDVGLDEFAVAALLRPLATPDLLDLVATERELEVTGVLEDVPRERHREVEVQSEAGVPVVRFGVQPAQDVDLLLHLPLAGQRVERLDGRRLERRETVQLERRAQPVENRELDIALGRQQLGEAR
jgi:hypothetical protein